MRFMISSNLLNAVEACCSREDSDHRTYLFGWHIDVEREVLVGTNGHILLTAPISITTSPEPDERVPDVILPLKVPATIVSFDVTVDTVETTARYNTGKKYKTVELREGIGTFPSWRLPVSNRDKAPNGDVGKVSFDPALLSDVTKALDGKGERKAIVTIEMKKDEKDPHKVTVLGYPDVDITLMLCRT